MLLWAYRDKVAIQNCSRYKPKIPITSHRKAMKPLTPAARKKNETISYTCGTSTLGVLLMAQSQQGICAILLGDHEDDLVKELMGRFPGANVQPSESAVSELMQQLVKLIEQPTQLLPLPLDIRGTLFQQRVWALLQQIPVGETRSYTQIAQALGAPKAIRAVAGACAANALALVIPCHRVVRSDGQLAGYRWGLERKKTLLQRERDAGGRNKNP